MNALTVFCPAKLNLFLAVTGKRTDGYHDLLSLATPIAFGDSLAAEARGDDRFELRCDEPGVPADESNLVLKAAREFRAVSGWGGGARFILEKRAPAGAGLGGGSSDAVGALLALNEISGGALSAAALSAAAAKVGSDCPLFLRKGPVVMRGRGDILEEAPAAAVRRLRGRRVAVFKPGFGIATAWAYGRMAGHLVPAARAEEMLSGWLAGEAPAEELLFNHFEGVAFSKYPALPALAERLRGRFGLAVRMTGSGSACFALLPAEGGPPADALASAVREAWGPSAFFVETAIL